MNAAARLMRNPGLSALIGGLLMLPFVAANEIVRRRVEPFFSWIRPGYHTSPMEYVLLFLVIGCLPVGGFIAARPMLHGGADGRRRIYLSNAIVAVLMFAAFVTLSVALGVEIFRCEILKIPNCD